MPRQLWALFPLLVSSICASSVQPSLQVVRVGRIPGTTGPLAPARQSALARYLESKASGYSFEFVTFERPSELVAAAKDRKIDFAHVSASVFVELAVRHGATAVATAVLVPRPGLEVQTLGGVVFCRAEETGIRQLADLRGKRVAATDPRTLGGALTVFRELRALGIRPEKDLKEVHYLGRLVKIVDAVLGGRVDCGLTAAHSLEANFTAGRLKRSQVRILPPSQAFPGIQEYPLAVSTRLYPAAPFVKMHHTPLALANQVSIALLALEPGGELARDMGVSGWSVPLDYQPVHECLQELGVAPYERFGKVTAMEAVRQHWSKVLLGLVAIILALATATGRAMRLNRRLRSSQSALELELEQRRLAEQDRERLEEQLRQSQKLESVGRLAGGVAHDFNNLLTVINGYSDLLLMKLGRRDPVRDRVVQIREAGERAASLTQQLLAFSRNQIVQPVPLDLNAVVGETERLLRRVVGEDIEIVTLLDPSLGVVQADPTQLNQVLMNLAVNARDAMPGGGKLIVETANVEFDESCAAGHSEVTPGPYVLLAVTDTGAGMDAEVRRHLFEPFFTTKERGKGTGLGLSTVYGIVRQSGGFVWVYSEPGKGSTFKIYLPRTDVCAEPESKTRSVSVELHGTETVLVVEDQEEVRRLASEALVTYGYRVLEATRGEEALVLAGRHSGPIHLLLTDVVMPGMTGRDLAQRLAPLRPETKVLYMSGYTANVIAHKGTLDPGVAYIPKPFTPDGLAAKVRETLGPPAA